LFSLVEAVSDTELELPVVKVLAVSLVVYPVLTPY
jgi:hypothetical protein